MLLGGRFRPAWQGLRKSVMVGLVAVVSLAACVPVGAPRANAWDLDPGYDNRRPVYSSYPVAAGAGYSRRSYRAPPVYYPPRQAYYPRQPEYYGGRPDYYGGRPDHSGRYDQDRDRDRGREEARDHNRDRERAQQRERERDRDRQRERERDRDRDRERQRGEQRPGNGIRLPPSPGMSSRPQPQRRLGPLECIPGQGGQRGCD